MPVEAIERAFRFALDTSPRDVAVLERNAGAARWAFNFAHAQILAYHRAWDERRQAAGERLAGISREQILTTLDKRTRTALYRQAGRAVTAENRSLCAELKTWDLHRSRVMHKGKPALEPGDLPGPGASRLERDLFWRRAELAALQQSDPAAYAVERKKELAEVRPSVFRMKTDLAARGAYMPGDYDLQATWRALRENPSREGGCPWWNEVATGAFLCGIARASVAWKNWMTSAAGKRQGPRMGMPRFKKKGRARESFALANPSRSVIHLDDYRHLRLVGVGTLRLHQSAKKLSRLVRAGQADITSVTISRSGHRWYACVLAKVQQTIPAKPSARQRRVGLVAADLGSAPLVVLSGPLDVTDPASSVVASCKPYHAEQDRLTRAHRAVSRTVKGSRRRHKAVRRVARIHGVIAERRASFLHGVSKKMATSATHIAIEDLDLIGLTASAKGTAAEPGRRVKVKSQFNRHLLDAGLGELRRQLAYKTRWYGSTLIVLKRDEPTASKCSRCGERNPSSKPGDRHFICPNCGLDVDRRTNSVRTIHQAACRVVATSVACGERDTQNALRDGDQPRAGDGVGALSLKSPPP